MTDHATLTLPGILMPNGRDYLPLYYAINCPGARAVLLNARYRGDDLACVIPKARIEWLFIGGQARDFCDCRTVLAEAFGGDASLASIQAQAPSLKGIIEPDDDFDRLIETNGFVFDGTEVAIADPAAS